MPCPSDNITIGRNIRIYRLKAGLTHKLLCKRLYQHYGIQLKSMTLKVYEMGKSTIPAMHLHPIAAVLQQDIGVFYQQPCPDMLMEGNSFRLVEAYRSIKRRSHQDAILHLAKGLAGE